jgi:hypothetical protein
LPRLIVIDEDINKRRASELRKRGRNARGIAELLGTGLDDAALLGALAAHDPECVLVTGDDNMPAEHADVLLETNLTVAIVSPRLPPEYTQEEWEAEIIHRWVHRIDAQATGTIRRYSLGGAAIWTPRRRPRALRGPHDAGEIMPAAPL